MLTRENEANSEETMTIVHFMVMVTSLCHVRAPSRAASDRARPGAALFKFQMLACRWHVRCSQIGLRHVRQQLATTN